MDPNCSRCEGSGRARIYRCPRKVITDEARALLRAYRDYDRGFLPVPGGMEDQAAGFSRWIGIVDAERTAIEEERASMQRARARGPRTAAAETGD